MVAPDPRAPCIIGVAAQTWHPADVGEGGAPEPLAMWETVARAAAADTTRPRVLEQLESVQIVYCQTWQYDDAVARLSDRLGVDPQHRHYSGIGGTTTQQLVDATAERMLRGDLDLALITSAEALATQRVYKKRGERFAYSFKPDEKRPFPWESAPDPIEIAHEVFQAWLTFAVFDNARRARYGVGLDAYRDALGEMLAPMSVVAAGNPHAWFPIARSPAEIITPAPDNRMVGYPYTKYAVAVMDVDMAGALIVATHERRRRARRTGRSPRVSPRLGVRDRSGPRRRTSRPRELSGHARRERRGAAGCRCRRRRSRVPRSVLVFRQLAALRGDALGIAPTDARGLTVTGGLPYHGGPASGYLTHSIAAMVERLRADPGAFGLVSGVGMHMTKHVFGCYSTEPSEVRPPDRMPTAATMPMVATHEGDARVEAYSVVHGR